MKTMYCKDRGKWEIYVYVKFTAYLLGAWSAFQFFAVVVAGGGGQGEGGMGSWGLGERERIKLSEVVV